MTEQEILQLRDLAEAGQVQFKERIVSKDDKYDIGCEMVAFSNSRGGRLIIGINDKSGHINALSYQELQETTNLLTNIASENVIPNVLIDVDNAPVTGGAVVVATIPEGKNKPYHDNKVVIWVKNGSNYLLPYTGAGSGVRRALEYDPDVIFSNGINEKEITHSANEFVITIPRKTDPVYDQDTQKTTNLTQKTDPGSDQAAGKSEQPTDQPAQNTTHLTHETDPACSKNEQPNDPTTSKSEQPHIKLTQKQKDIRNICTVPRTTREIMGRLGLSDFYNNRKRYIYDLVEAVVLERTIPDKPNDPNQKYRRKL